MVSRSMISALIAVKVWWFLLLVAIRCSPSMKLGVVFASEIGVDSSSVNDKRAFDASLAHSGSNNRRAKEDGYSPNAARHPPQQQRERPFMLGVMVDAGRHEFSVDWIQNFMGSVHKLGFNALHLTLASDQRFAFAVPKPQPRESSVENATRHDAGLARLEWIEASEPRFTIRDLKSLAQHASSIGNMTIIPELSLPFFAASWAGAPHSEIYGLLPPPCPRYICSGERALPISGTNLPLDIRHPRLPEILRSVLGILVESLEKPAYLHLGDLISSSYHSCWEEVFAESVEGEEPQRPDYDDFENTLAGIVANDLGYRPRIIRGLDDAHDSRNFFGGHADVLQHQNYKQLGKKSVPPNTPLSPYFLQPKELNLATTLLKDHPTGFAVYQETLKILQAHQPSFEIGMFEGMIISTEALPPSWFEERNVMGRLLAISMAVRSFLASSRKQDEDVVSTSHDSKQQRVYKDQIEFETEYLMLCNELFPIDSATGNRAKMTHFCKRLGGLNNIPISTSGIAIPKNLNDAYTKKALRDQTVAEDKYKREYSEMWKGWAKDICDRLVETREELIFRTPAPNVMHSLHDESFSAYWRDLDGENNPNNEKSDKSPAVMELEAVELVEEHTIQESSLLHEVFSHIKIPFRGFIVDTINDAITPEVLRDLIVQIMMPLGLNTLQLSLVNNLGCSIQLESLEGLYHLVPKATKPLTEGVLRQIVAAGDRYGIELIPEISITTEAAGWYHAGFLVDCPNTLCSTGATSSKTIGGAIANNVNAGSLLPVVLRVIQKLRSVFHSSSFMHLGSDERTTSEACWNESGRVPDYDGFERKLSRFLESKKWFNASNILRWENREGTVYPHRTGRVTHYQYERLSSQLDQNKSSLVPARRIATNDRENVESNLLAFGSLSISSKKDPWTIYQETLKWVTEEGIPPTGLLARISLNEFESNSNYRKMASLAFAIGLSSVTPILNDESSLIAYISEICNGMDIDLCISNSTKEVPKIQVNSAHRSQMMCKAMTSTVSHPLMRSRITAKNP